VHPLRLGDATWCNGEFRHVAAKACQTPAKRGTSIDLAGAPLPDRLGQEAARLPRLTQLAAQDSILTRTLMGERGNGLQQVGYLR
jgi:hypothetical protein